MIKPATPASLPPPTSHLPPTHPPTRFDLGSIMTRAASMWYPSDPIPPAASYDSDGASAGSAATTAAGSVLPSALASHPGSDAEDWGEDGGYAAPKAKGAVVCDAGFMTDGAG